MLPKRGMCSGVYVNVWRGEARIRKGSLEKQIKKEGGEGGPFAESKSSETSTAA